MIIRPKDHIYWEVLFDTQEEAEAFKDYWEQVFVRGYNEEDEKNILADETKRC